MPIVSPHHPALSGDTVAVDLPCLKCTYNLRGLRADGLCPECGLPVARSLQGSLLRHADRDWGEKVVRGLGILLWTLPICIVAANAFSVSAIQELARVIRVLGSIGVARGVWLVSAAAPPSDGGDRRPVLRFIVRGGAALGAAGQVIGWLRGVDVLPGGAAGIAEACAILLTYAGTASDFGMFSYYVQFARRTQAPQLARHVKVLRWTIFGSLGILVLMGALMAIMSRTPQAVFTWLPRLNYVCIAAAVVLGAALIVMFVVLIRLRRAVAREVRHTRYRPDAPAAAEPEWPRGEDGAKTSDFSGRNI